MLVFISYPREFEKVAATLDAELKSRKIATFLDKESINLTDVWQLEIESNIKRADIFVVLYLPEAATPNRFFRIETERIQNECAENNAQRLITVIFPPTTPRNLPAFFRSHQVLMAEAKGDCEDERDGYWIDQIVQEVERLKKEKENKKRRKWRQIIARTTLVTAGVIIVSLLYSKSPNGKSLCHSLVGHYALHQKYLFTSGVDIRSIATKATWKATGCEHDERNDIYVLKGEEDTDFDIEFVTNGKYERIATARFIYPSRVTISKDGKLLGRTFASLKTPNDVNRFYQDRDGNKLNRSESFIDEKIEDVIEIRNKTQKDPATTSCTPLLAEMGGNITIAFVCHDYTRVMIKVS